MGRATGIATEIGTRSYRLRSRSELVPLCGESGRLSIRGGTNDQAGLGVRNTR